MSDSSLVARRLASVRLAICASSTYLAERGTPKSPADLGNHDCLGHTLVTLTGTAVWGFRRDGAEQVPIRGSLHVSNGEALVHVAVAGQGLVYGPRFIAAHALRQGELVEVNLGAEYMDLGAVHAVTHLRRRLSVRVRSWLDFLAKRVPEIADDW